nr:MAG TPA: hypothetical protein [Caudoviricetes sp.]
MHRPNLSAWRVTAEHILCRHFLCPYMNVLIKYNGFVPP